jgi:hypothetical protein
MLLTFPKSIGALIGVLYLSIQIFNNIYICFTPSKHFFWAPHTVQVNYHLEGRSKGEKVPESVLRDRYGLGKANWEAHAVENLMDCIRFNETHIGQNDSLEIKLTYSINGNKTNVWQFP